MCPQFNSYHNQHHYKGCLISPPPPSTLQPGDGFHGALVPCPPCGSCSLASHSPPRRSSAAAWPTPLAAWPPHNTLLSTRGPIEPTKRTHPTRSRTGIYNTPLPCKPPTPSPPQRSLAAHFVFKKEEEGRGEGGYIKAEHVESRARNVKTPPLDHRPDHGGPKQTPLCR